MSQSERVFDAIRGGKSESQGKEIFFPQCEEGNVLQTVRRKNVPQSADELLKQCQEEK